MSRLLMQDAQNIDVAGAFYVWDRTSEPFQRLSAMHRNIEFRTRAAR